MSNLRVAEMRAIKMQSSVYFSHFQRFFRCFFEFRWRLCSVLHSDVEKRKSYCDQYLMIVICVFSVCYPSVTLITFLAYYSASIRLQGGTMLCFSAKKKQYSDSRQENANKRWQSEAGSSRQKSGEVTHVATS